METANVIINIRALFNTHKTRLLICEPVEKKDNRKKKNICILISNNGCVKTFIITVKTRPLFK